MPGLRRRRSVRGAVFDLFHTLADPEEFRPPEFNRALFTAAYFGFDPEHLKSAWESDAPRRYMDRTRTIRSFLEEYAKALGRKWPLDEDTLAGYDRQVGFYQDLALTRPVAGAVECLRRLKRAGIRLGLLSNAEERDCRSWTLSPLCSLLDATCFSFEIGVGKPQPQAYEEILGRLGLTARECAYVGDGGMDELGGARRAGFGLVILAAGHLPEAWIDYEERLKREEQAHLVARDFDEIVSAILGHEGPAAGESVR